jgi:hypothetical protein
MLPPCDQAAARGVSAQSPVTMIARNTRGFQDSAESVVSSNFAKSRERTMAAKNSKEARDRAEASFQKKELQAREGNKAMADYHAATRAVHEKTAKLRELRLAKEEQDRKAAFEKRAAPPKKRKPQQPAWKPTVRGRVRHNHQL